jgi:hypothetical protein
VLFDVPPLSEKLEAVSVVANHTALRPALVVLSQRFVIRDHDTVVVEERGRHIDQLFAVEHTPRVFEGTATGIRRDSESLSGFEPTIVFPHLERVVEADLCSRLNRSDGIGDKFPFGIQQSVRNCDGMACYGIIRYCTTVHGFTVISNVRVNR